LTGAGRSIGCGRLGRILRNDQVAQGELRVVTIMSGTAVAAGLLTGGADRSLLPVALLDGALLRTVNVESDRNTVETFDVRIVLEHVGSGDSSIPARYQPDLVSVLEQGQPKPAAVDWSDIRRSNQSVILYKVEAPNQFEATAAGKDIFERVLRPHLERFHARLGNLEATASPRSPGP
jgi:hypothetical protein